MASSIKSKLVFSLPWVTRSSLVPEFRSRRLPGRRVPSAVSWESVAVLRLELHTISTISIPYVPCERGRVSFSFSENRVIFCFRTRDALDAFGKIEGVGEGADVLMISEIRA
jgi:hypothetical protein